MARTAVELIGEKDLYRALDKLDGEMNRRILNSTVKEAAKPAVDRLKAEYKRYEPRLVESVRAKQVRKSTGKAGALVGPWRKKGFFFPPKSDKRIDKAYAHMAAHWHEFGTYSGTKLKARHSVRKNIDPAFRDVKETFGKILHKKTNSYVKRISKKIGLI